MDAELALLAGSLMPEMISCVTAVCPTNIREKNFAHPCKCVSYQYACPILVPVKSRSTVMFRAERKYPEQCWESDMDAFEKTLAFWKEVW